LPRFVVRLQDDRFLMHKKENLNWRILIAEGFGYIEGEHIVLSPIEIAYLILKNKVCLQPTMTVEDIIYRYSESDPLFPLKFSVYLDLRERRFIVRVLDEYPISFEVFGRGSDPLMSESKYYVMILPSEKSVAVQILYNALEKARNRGKILVLAIIDQDGNIVYYNIESTLRFKVSLKLRRLKIV